MYFEDIQRYGVVSATISIFLTLAWISTPVDHERRINDTEFVGEVSVEWAAYTPMRIY